MNKLLLLIVLVIMPNAFAEPDSIYLFRHAEKVAGSDPELSIEGKKRASQLAALIDAQSITLFSSRYNRTQMTASPIAKHFNAPIQHYNPHDLMTLKQTILQQQGTVVVIGHSNTTPQLAGLISKNDVAGMAENQFNRYFILIKQLDGYRVVDALMSF